jgi:hypothetical protein
VILVRLLQAVGIIMAAASLAACPGIPNDDRYQIHDGGRSNTRAEAPDTGLKGSS